MRELVLKKAADHLGSMEAAEIWYDSIDPSAGKTPRQLVEEGKGEIVICLLENQGSIYS